MFKLNSLQITSDRLAVELVPLVEDSHEEQAVRRSGRACIFSSFRSDRCCHPLGWLLPLAHEDQSSNDSAYHFVKKGVPDNIHRQQIFALPNSNGVQPANTGVIAVSARALGGQGAKIVLPLEEGRGPLHGGQVEVLRHMPRSGRQNWAAGGSVEDLIAIVLAAS